MDTLKSTPSIVTVTNATPATPPSSSQHYKQLALNQATLNEIQALQLCASRHVVRLTSLFHNTDTQTYTLCFVNEGVDLSTLLTDGSPLANALPIFQDIVAAVSFLHSQSYCHRDIKPSNIIYHSMDQTIRLADFGFACDSSQPLTGAVGSPGYMPPEMFTHPMVGYDGNKADVWSCGVLLVELTLGSAVFEAKWMRVGPFSDIGAMDTGSFQTKMLRALTSLKDLGREEKSKTAHYSEEIGRVFRKTVCLQVDRRFSVSELLESVVGLSTCA